MRPTYDFSTLFTTLPHNQIKLIGLIEGTFNREDSLTLHVTKETHFLIRKNLRNIMHGPVKMYVMH